MGCELRATPLPVRRVRHGGRTFHSCKPHQSVRRFDSCPGLHNLLRTLTFIWSKWESCPVSHTERSGLHVCSFSPLSFLENLIQQRRLVHFCAISFAYSFFLYLSTSNYSPSSSAAASENLFRPRASLPRKTCSVLERRCLGKKLSVLERTYDTATADGLTLPIPIPIPISFVQTTTIGSQVRLLPRASQLVKNFNLYLVKVGKLPGVPHRTKWFARVFILSSLFLGKSDPTKKTCAFLCFSLLLINFFLSLSLSLSQLQTTVRPGASLPRKNASPFTQSSLLEILFKPHSACEPRCLGTKCP